MKFKIKERKPKLNQIIVIKSKLELIPIVGIWELNNGKEEVYIPIRGDIELPNNIEWWVEIPE